MGDATPARLRPHEIALLSGGARAAVTVAVVALHLRGAVEAGLPGTLRASGAAEATVATGDVTDPLERTVLGCLQEPLSPPELARHPDVRVATAELLHGPADAGLLGPRLLRPTREARRLVRELRERHPVPTSRRGLSADDKLLAVALHGDAALAALVPRFALRAGLIPRAQVADKGMLRHTPRSDGTWDRTLLWGGYDSGDGGGYESGGGGGGGGGD